MGARRGATCPICEKPFAQAYSLTIHMRIHNGEKPFPCSTCGRRFTQAHSRTKHERTHTGERLHGCPVCGKRFGEAFMLKRHLRVHTGDKPFRCLECGRAFADKFGLKRHLKTHVSVKAHGCAECGQSFSNAWALATHQLQHMGIANNCVNQNDFQNVTVLKVKADETRNVAPEATATLQTQQQVQPVQVQEIQHIQLKPSQVSQSTQPRDPLHLPETSPVSSKKGKPHVCLVCNKSYSDAWALTKHSWVHTGIKPYSCAECGKGFGDKWSLTKHIRVHAGDRPNECFLCGQCFADKISLQNHLSVHTGEKPYICDVCGKCFEVESALQEHRSGHGEREQHSCPVCTRIFMTKRGVTDHWKKHCGKNNPSAIEAMTTTVENSIPTTLCTVELKPDQDIPGVTLTVAAADFPHTQVAHVVQVETQPEVQQAHAGKELWVTPANWETASILEVSTSGTSDKIEGKTTTCYFCEICHKTFHQLSMLEKHKLTHSSGSKAKVESQSEQAQSQSQTEDSENRCSNCEKTFGSAECLKTHEESGNCHKNCGICGKTFRIISPDGVQIISSYCDSCTITQHFDARGELIVPKRTQHATWAFDATHLATFQKHITVHSDGNKACTCGHCENGFLNHSTLPTHVLTIPTAGV